VCTDPDQASAVEWVLVATKTYAVPGAAAWLARLVGRDTRLAVMQNGVEHVSRFAPHASAERIVPVVVGFAAERGAPGRLRQRDHGRLTVPDSNDGRMFASLFTHTPIEVVLTPDIQTALWRKLCLNAAGVVCALVLKPAGIARHDAIADLMRGIIREAVAVGRAEGAALDDSVVESTIDSCRRAPPDGVNSILADRLAGRPTEIDARNGVIVRLGRRHGIATPLNAMAVALLSV
jgi:2-dehydropantoate 2-reductase